MESATPFNDFIRKHDILPEPVNAKEYEGGLKVFQAFEKEKEEQQEKMGLVSVVTGLPCTVAEALEILIDYSGHEREYTKSLDELMKIWKVFWKGHNDIMMSHGIADMLAGASSFVYMNGVTVEEGAAIATAMKIKEMNETRLTAD